MIVQVKVLGEFHVPAPRVNIDATLSHSRYHRKGQVLLYARGNPTNVPAVHGSSAEVAPAMTSSDLVSRLIAFIPWANARAIEIRNVRTITATTKFWKMVPFHA